MKSYSIFLIILLLISLSCKKSSVEPEAPKSISLSEYGSGIDQYYYKTWSDSSWERFNRTVTIGGIFYATIITSSGDELYYNESGFAGFKLNGDSLILFDAPMSSLPDVINFNQKYNQTVSFTYMGIKFTMQDETTLLDTQTVSVSFGTFKGCLWMDSKSTLSSGGQSDIVTSQSWMAKGPATIKQKLDSGEIILMTEGIVNGKGWGVSFPKLSINKNKVNISGIKKITKYLSEFSRHKLELKLLRR